MISSTIRILSQPLIKNRSITKTLQPARNTWVYRERAPPGPKWEFYAADVMSAFTWWWIFVHTYYQWGHIVGEYDYPEPEKWTDAELGIVDIDA